MVDVDIVPLASAIDSRAVAARKLVPRARGGNAGDMHSDRPLNEFQFAASERHGASAAEHPVVGGKGDAATELGGGEIIHRRENYESRAADIQGSRSIVQAAGDANRSAEIKERCRCYRQCS